MTQVAYLPTLSVQIAFNPTNVFSLTQTWTDCTAYVRDFQTRHGRQHYLDRIEAGTIDMTLDGRTGFFLNGGSAPGNGTGYVIQPRLPIKVTATWSGTTYAVFWGLIDSIEEIVADQQNIDLRVTASERTKHLSLKYLSNSKFYPKYATVASTQNYYRLGGTQPYVVTSAVATGTSVTYQCNNAFTTTGGQYVSIYGLLNSSNTASALNLTNVQVTSATATSFTVSSTVAAQTSYTQNGVAYLNQTTDLVGGTNTATYSGQVSFTTNGAMVYDPQNATDLGNGSSSPSAWVNINANIGASGSSYGADLWVIGNGLNAVAGGIATTVLGNWNGSSQIASLQVDTQGFLYLYYVDNSNAAANYYVKDGSGNNIQVADGYWHHVGFHVIGGKLYVYCDGHFTLVTSTLAQNLTAGYEVGTFGGGTYATAPCYAQDVVVCGSTISQTDVLNRYIAGALLARGKPLNGESIYSGTRICEVLALAGYGTIDSTQTNPLISTTGLFYVDGVDVSTMSPYTPYTSSTSNTIGTGTKTFTVSSGLTIGAGQAVVVSDSTNLNTMTGTVTSYSGTTLTLSITSTTGSGTFTSWFITIPVGTLLTEPYFWDSPVYGSTCLDLIFQITDTDIGPFWQKRDGTFQYYSSKHYGTWTWNPSTKTGTWSSTYATNTYTPSATYRWSDDGGSTYYYNTDSLSVMRDDADTWTTVKVTPQSGIEQVYENTTNEPRYGYSTLTKSSTVHASLSDALSTANYLGYLYQSPLPRVNNVELKARTGSGTNLVSMLGSDLGDVVLFHRYAGVSGNSLYSQTGTYPTQQGVIVQNMIIEAVSHVFNADPGEWYTSFVLDPYPVRS